MARANEEKIVEKPIEGSPQESPRPDIVNDLETLPYDVQRRLAVVQRLQSYQSRADYGSEKQRAVQELGISARSLRRLQRKYQEQGLEGLKRQSRSDHGQSKVSEEWQEFIVKAYQKGNRGRRQTSRAEIAKLVESRAAELGEAK